MTSTVNKFPIPVIDATSFLTTASTSASSAAASASAASASATTASDAADAASASASSAASSATAAAGSATSAAESAGAITGLTAVASTLTAGSSATASWDPETGTLTLGIPAGATGEQGPAGDPATEPTTESIRGLGALMDDELANIAAVKGLNQGVATTDNVAFGGATVSKNGTQLLDVVSADGGAVQVRMLSDSANRRFVALNNAGSPQSQVLFENNQIRLAGIDNGANLMATFTPAATTIAGTVNGRNMAADGTKLDGLVTQTSVIDGAGDRILKMNSTGSEGPFGTGGLVAPLLTNLDATDTPNGRYTARGGSFTAGTFPAGASTFGAVEILRYSGTDFIQIYYGVTTDALWFRRYRSASGGFQPWERLDNPIPKTQVFTSFTTFVALSNTPIDAAHVEVFFDGLFQNPNEYTLSGNTITFTNGQPAGVTNVQVRYWHY